MGLDNIPKHYPCRTKNTAVLVPRLGRDGTPLLDDDGNDILVVDCAATQDAGGCPWLTSYQNAGEPGLPVYGMLGSDCWYRGKYGNWLLEELTVADPMGDGESFYGDNEDGTEKSAESCHLLADLMDEALADQGGSVHLDGKDVTGDVRYAIWWLRWVADEADGSICWY